MLSQLIYVSKRNARCTEAEIHKILTACRTNNKPLDVTGVLLYSDQQFVQYLEGSYQQIIGLYDKIKLDPRHEDVRLINCTPIKDRIFPSWQMGAKKLDGEEINYQTDMPPSEQREFNSILAGKENNKASTLIQKFFR